MLGPAFRPIAQPNLDVGVTKIFEPASGSQGEFPDDLDGIYLLGQIGENGRLVPEAGTYLEHAIARLNIEEVCHECYHERLGYCLPKPDR